MSPTACRRIMAGGRSGQSAHTIPSLLLPDPSSIPKIFDPSRCHFARLTRLGGVLSHPTAPANAP